MNGARVWLVTSTVPTRDEAVKLARAVVKEKLASGAEITGPATSVFWHLGELGEGEEWRVTFRTTMAAREDITTFISDMHPWDNPEISGFPLPWCPDDYAEWVERTTTGPELEA